MTEIEPSIDQAIDALHEALVQNKALLIVTDSMARRGDIARAFVNKHAAKARGNRFDNSAFPRILNCIILEDAVKDLVDPKPELFFETKNR
jgi:hypothetical protein